MLALVVFGAYDSYPGEVYGRFHIFQGHFRFSALVQLTYTGALRLGLILGRRWRSVEVFLAIGNHLAALINSVREAIRKHSRLAVAVSVSRCAHGCGRHYPEIDYRAGAARRRRSCTARRAAPAWPRRLLDRFDLRPADLPQENIIKSSLPAALLAKPL